MKLTRNRTLSNRNLGGFDYGETKKNIINYFDYMETLEWEWEKLNIQKGLTANYDLSTQYRKQPYVKVGKDDMNLSAKELTEERLKECLINFYWAKNILSKEEQIYLMEHLINGKYEKEIVDLLGFTNRDSNEYKRIKLSAVYKFGDFLNLLVEKEQGKEINGTKNLNR